MYTFTEKETYDLIPAGDYEVVLEKAERKVGQTSGTPYISLSFKIRSDVEQPQQGRMVFETIFLDKERPNQFDHKKLGAIIRSQGKEGKYTFADDDELIQYINGLLMKITIEIKGPDQYHTEDYNQVKFCSYKPSKFPLQSVMNNMQETFGDAFSVEDEDLPF